MERRAKLHNLDVVIPIYNEAENILHVIEETEKEVVPFFNKVSLIFVDDGSNDNTFRMIVNMNSRSALKIRYIKLSTNFRKDLAVKCGIDHSSADFCAVMDGDLQQPSAKIVEAYRKAVQEGYEIIHIMKSQYKTKFYRKAGSSLFSLILNKTAGFEIHLTDFKLFTNRVAEELRHRNEKKLFFAGIVERIGFKQSQIYYNVEKRKHGKSYFSFTNLIKLSVKSITCVSVKPLRLASFVGFFLATGSLLFTLMVIIEKLFCGQDIPGFTTIVGGLFFLGGLQLLVLGIIGEYIGQIYYEVKNTKQYILEDDITIEAIDN